MKKVVKFASLLLVGGTLIFTSCGKKEDNPTPTPNTDTPVVQPDVLVDASTLAGIAASKGKGFTFNVNNADGTKNIRMEIKAKSNISKMYILKSEDNGNSVPYTATSSVTTENGKELTSGSTNHSYDFPTGIPAFTATFPFNVRSTATAVSDVYTIWFTSGTGDFLNTGKRTIVGPFTVTLNYKANSGAFLSASGVVVGSQQASEPSYVTTSGKIGTLFGTSLGTDLVGEEKVNALNSVDFSFVTLNSAGTALGDTPYFVSVSERKSLGLANDEGTAVTKFALYTGDFAGATASSLSSATGSVTKIAVTAGSTYSYVTSDGRKGLINVNTVSAGTGGGSQANLDIKVTSSK